MPRPDDTPPPIDGRLGLRIIDWCLWSWRIPELRAFPAGPRRRAAFREAHRELSGMRGGLSWLFVLVLFGVPLLLAPRSRTAAPCAGVLVAVTAASVFFDRPKLRELRISVRRQLVKSGSPVCLGCGYDLRNLDKRNCPECGEAQSTSPG